MKLNIGCGPAFEGDIRIDIGRTKAVNIIADAHYIPLRDEIFSQVFCTEVLEHVESALKVLKEVERVMREDGFALVTVPNLTELRRMLSIAKNPLRIRHIETDHKQGWDAIEFSRLAFQVGLHVAKIDWTDWYNRTRRKEKFKFLNPLLKRILPKQLYYTHMKIICRKVGAQVYNYPMSTK